MMELNSEVAVVKLRKLINATVTALAAVTIATLLVSQHLTGSTSSTPLKSFLATGSSVYIY